MPSRQIISVIRKFDQAVQDSLDRLCPGAIASRITDEEIITSDDTVEVIELEYLVRYKGKELDRVPYLLTRRR
jgi:hypothetical protein